MMYRQEQALPEWQQKSTPRAASAKRAIPTSARQAPYAVDARIVHHPAIEVENRTRTAAYTLEQRLCQLFED